MGRETLIQWSETIRNREYCTGSEGTQWNVVLEKKLKKIFFLKIVAVFIPTQLQISFPLHSDRPRFKAVSSITCYQREKQM